MRETDPLQECRVSGGNSCHQWTRTSRWQDLDQTWRKWEEWAGENMIQATAYLAREDLHHYLASVSSRCEKGRLLQVSPHTQKKLHLKYIQLPYTVTLSTHLSDKPWGQCQYLVNSSAKLSTSRSSKIVEIRIEGERKPRRETSCVAQNIKSVTQTAKGSTKSFKN